MRSSVRISRKLHCAACLAALLACASGRAQDNIISEGDPLKYFKGSVAPPADWNVLAFDDSTWLDGATPIGYSTDLTYATVLDDMQNANGNPGYWSVYIRKKFSISNPSTIKGFKFRVKWDDGFVAYINGTEVLRQNMPAGVPTNTTAATDHETNVTFMDLFIPCSALTGLQGGDNVLAIESHNGTLASSDLSMSYELAPLEDVCPTNMTCQLRPTGQVLLRWTKPTGFTYDAYKLSRNGVLIDPGPKGNATSFTDKTPVTGDNKYQLIATACGVDCSGANALECTVTVGGTDPMFRRGDADENSAVNITDAVKTLGYLFQGQPAPGCLDAADADDNGTVNITDAVYLLASLFQGGPPPPDPGRETCGIDPTPDDLAPCTTTCQ